MKAKTGFLRPGGIGRMLFLSAVVLILWSCSQTLVEKTPALSAGQGLVEVRVQTGEGTGRTLLPDAGEFRYVVSFLGVGGELVVPSAGPVIQVLDAGLWTILVTGLLNDPDYDIAVAAGSGEVTVTAGTTVSVAISLRPRTDEGDGTFAYDIGFDPAIAGDISEAWLSLTSLSNQSNRYEVKLKGSDSGANPGTFDIPPGYYRLSLSAVKGGQPMLLTETAHIYPYLSTRKVYTIGAADFTNQVYLGGTVSLDPAQFSGYTLKRVHAWNTGTVAPGPSEYTAETSAGTGAWDLVLPLSVTGRYYFKVELEQGAGSRYYSALLDRDVPAQGSGGLSLTVEDYEISLGDIRGGRLSSVRHALEGETVQLLVRENPGYTKNGDPAVNAVNGGAVSLAGSGNSYSFTMPPGSVEILADIFEPPSPADMIGYPTIMESGVDTGNLWMAYVPAVGNFPMGMDDGGVGTVERPYWIGETEVTYELWNAVRTWAVTGSGAPGAGLYILNDGRQGSGGPGETDQYPVSQINWYDAVAWCNALTEWYNAFKEAGEDLEPVYYSDLACQTLIRGNTGPDFYPDPELGIPTAVIKPGASGFRLPDNEEWELAARWQGASYLTSDYVHEGNWYYTRGDSASGAADNTETAAQAVAVFTTDQTNPAALQEIRSKIPNGLGLYDMNGNVSEFCFGFAALRFSTSTPKDELQYIVRGGNYGDLFLYAWTTQFMYPLTVSSIQTIRAGTFTINPPLPGGTFGIRLARTAD
jgi:hypothetical protein